MNAFKINPWMQEILNRESNRKLLLSPNYPLQKKTELMDSMNSDELEKISRELFELLDIAAEKLHKNHDMNCSFHVDHY